MREYGFETRAIHAGQQPDPATGAIVTPIYQTSTYAQAGVGEHQGYEYSRTANPTRTALELCLASLEGAAHGLAFASGMAAEDAVLRTLSPGDHIVAGTDAYGGTTRLLRQVYAPSGYGVTAVEEFSAAWPEQTRLVWLETPTNPMLDVVDIAAVSALAHERGARCVVDNTFATPYYQRPLELGADIVVHSTTKYLGGHSDVVGGFVAVNDAELAERLRFLQNSVGAVPGPFDSWLVLRGVKTLAVRMDRHTENARAVVALLEGHDAVREVRYPGFGGMVSFTVRAGEGAALRVASATNVFTLAESLGAVESLIEHPGRMTHASVAGTPQAVDAALIRLSVGLESADDLVADLQQALEKGAAP